MKKHFLYILICLHGHLLFGQLRITTGAHWVNQGAPNIVLENLNLINDGNFAAGTSLIKFSGNLNSTISGTTITNFHELGIVKTGTNKLILGQNITVENRVIFITGLLELNQRELGLGPIAYLFNESETSRIIGLGGGEVSITLPMNAPVASNPGNLGAVISTGADMGSVNIRRGHKTQAGTGLPGSINRYFNISPTNNAGLNAGLRFNYFDAELNNQPENSLNLYRSVDAGLNWTNQFFSSRDANLNFVEQTAINSFSRWALSAGISFPDYTMVNSFPALNFPSAGFSRDFIVGAVNVNASASLDNPVTPLEFRIFKLVAFNITAGDNTLATNGTPVNNSDWIIDTSHPIYVKFTLKNGVSIPPNGSSLVGLTATRNQGIAPNTTGNITSVILNGSGGDLGNNNNTVATQIVAQ